jgi:hypothetical protein
VNRGEGCRNCDKLAQLLSLEIDELHTVAARVIAEICLYPADEFNDLK